MKTTEWPLETAPLDLEFAVSTSKEIFFENDMSTTFSMFCYFSELINVKAQSTL